MHPTVTVGFCVFLTLMTPGLCIKCFQCNSAEDPVCADLTVNDTNSHYYLPCNGDYDGNEPFCRKYVTSVVHLEDSTRIDRSCGWILSGREKMESCKSGDSDFLKRTVCVCSEDGCNASTQNVNYVFLTLFNSIIIIAYHLI